MSGEQRHYFIDDPGLEHRRTCLGISMFGRDFSFFTDAGVFSKGHLDAGTELLIKTAPPLPDGWRVADLGCGWGPVGVILAAMNPGARLFLTDINARAAALAADNIAANGLDNATAMECEGLSGVDGELDAVISNPPIRVGKAALYALMDEVHEKLRPGGMLMAVVGKKQGAPSMKTHLQELFGQCDVAARGSGFWILRCIKQNG